MRIQSRTTLTKEDVYAAAAYARSKGEDILVGEISQAPRGGIAFYCHSLHGTRATNRGDGRRAASWSAWGWLIADLFKRDPSAVINEYKGVESFRAQCQRYQPEGQSIKFLQHLPRKVTT